MDILVTGGAGFIGSHIVDRLVKEHHKVGVVDNLRSGKKENLNSTADFFEIDVRDGDKLSELFNLFKPQAVFHLAAQNEVPYSMEHPFEDQNTNIVGMMNVCEAAKPHHTKIIYSDTGGAYYGDVPEKDLPIPEDYPVRFPTSFYGVSKAAAEQYLKLYGHLFQLPWVSLRYANVFGPRQDGNREAGIVAIFTRKLLNKEIPTINGDGEHSRDYVFVDDVVDANLAALSYPQNDYFNIATGVRTSNNTVFAALEAELHTGFTPNYGPDRAGDARHVVLDPSKAKQLLHWSPKTDFASGVRQTVAFYT